MPETPEQLQQEAYLRGQQMRQRHREQQRVVTDEALAILAADFAQVYLFKSNQDMTAVAAHERAGICVRAFQEGYRSHHLRKMQASSPACVRSSGSFEKWFTLIGSRCCEFPDATLRNWIA